jgi:hypothetical protein
MSQSNAAAIRRRVNPPTQTPLPGSTPINAQRNNSNTGEQKIQQGNVNNPGLTLPQVISLVDRRLISLETLAKETKEFMNKKPENETVINTENPFVTEIELNTVIEEFNGRFELLATEIHNIKDILLKLQSYTMDVNKMLLNERVKILSELEPSNNGGFSLSSSVLDNELEISKNTSIDLRDLVKKEFVNSTEKDIELSE